MKEKKLFICSKELCSHKYPKVIRGINADYLVCYNCGNIEIGTLIPELLEIKK